MLKDTEIYARYQKWLEGISKVNARIKDLETEQESIKDKINDNIAETPDEMVELQTRLHHIDRELESAKSIKSEFKARKPFTTTQFINSFNECIDTLGEKLKAPIEKAIQARKALVEALSEYLKVQQEYDSEYAQERIQWERLYSDVDDDWQNHQNVFRQLKNADYLKSSLFEEIKTGPVMREGRQTTEICGE